MGIKLQFVCGSDISSRLIAWYGQAYAGYSHVDAILGDGSLLGARADHPGGTASGVQARPATYERWARRDVVELPSSPAQAFSWECWLRSQVGKPYDMGSIWGFVLGRPEHEEGRWICSALQTAALEHVNLMPKLPVHSSQVTPDSLRLLAYALGGKPVG